MESVEIFIWIPHYGNFLLHKLDGCSGNYWRGKTIRRNTVSGSRHIFKISPNKFLLTKYLIFFLIFWQDILLPVMFVCANWTAFNASKRCVTPSFVVPMNSRINDGNDSVKSSVKKERKCVRIIPLFDHLITLYPSPSCYDTFLCQNA